MGNQEPAKKAGFEDMQVAAAAPRGSYTIISTLPTDQQACLIPGTVPAARETETVNALIGSARATIIVYGRNANDDSVFRKYEQLVALGFQRTYVYPGGLFEWLLLQDVYGKEAFPTTTEELDILRFRPATVLAAGLPIQDRD